MEEDKTFFVHESSYVDDGVQIGRGTKIWHFCHVQGGAVIGERCSLGQNVNVARGVELQDDVFCGPSCVFTNVTFPRSAFPVNGRYERTLVKQGASLGANSTVVCGTTIGKCAMVGSGSVVTSDVKDYALVLGSPARQVGWLCACGTKLGATLVCSECGRSYSEVESGLVEKVE